MRLRCGSGACFNVRYQVAVANQGFPRGGDANPPGVPTYDFAKFSQKLHEIEGIWTPRRGTCPKCYNLDPHLFSIDQITYPLKGAGFFIRQLYENEGN